MSSTTNSSIDSSFLTHVFEKLQALFIDTTLSNQSKLQQLHSLQKQLSSNVASISQDSLFSKLFLGLVPYLAENNPIIKAWILEWLHQVLIQFKLSLQVQAQVACTCIQAVTNSLQDPSHEVVKNAIQVLGPMTAIFFAMAIQDANYVPTWQAMLQLRNSLLPLLHQVDLHVAIQCALLKYLQRMVLLLSSGGGEETSSSLNEISLHQLPLYHSLLHRETLSKEGASLLHQFLDLVTSGIGSTSRMSLSLHLLLQIATVRPAFASHVALAWTSWPQLPHHPLKHDRFSRLIKYGLMHLSKHCALPPALQTKVSVHLVQWGGKHMKSLATQKKKLELVDRKLFAEMLQQLDLHALPLSMLIEMILHSLQAFELDEIKSAITNASDVHFSLPLPPPSTSSSSSLAPVPSSSSSSSSSSTSSSLDTNAIAMATPPPPPLPPPLSSSMDEKMNTPEQQLSHLDSSVVPPSPSSSSSFLPLVDPSSPYPFPWTLEDQPNELHEIHVMELFTRLLRSETLFKTFPSSHVVFSTTRSTSSLWLSMVTRLLGKVYPTSSMAEQLYQLFVDFVCLDFKKRWCYFVSFLVHLPTLELRHTWFNLVWERVSTQEHHSVLLRFILASPTPPYTTTLLPNLESHASHSPTCLMTCLLVCQELLEFPKLRSLSFEILCRLSRHPLKQVRTPAILTLKQVSTSYPMLTSSLIDFAESGFQTSSTSAFELLFALCAKTPCFFSNLFKVYIQSPHPKLIRKETEALLKAITYSQDLYDAVKQFPEGSETLVLKLLVVLMEKEEPEENWVQLVFQLYQERGLSGKFLLPIIGKLEQDTVLEHLPAIVKLLDGSDQSKKIWKEVVTRICEGESPLIPPMLLIITLHRLEGKVELKKIIQALDIAIVDLRSLFKQDTLAKAFQQLLSPRPPTLFMRTLLCALQVYPTFTSFMKTMLMKLTTLDPPIWTQKTLWEGFLRVFQKTLPKSITVMFNLPPDQVKEVMVRIQGAKMCVLEFIEMKQLHKQPRVMALAPVLGLEQESYRKDETKLSPLALNLKVNEREGGSKVMKDLLFSPSTPSKVVIDEDVNMDEG